MGLAFLAPAVVMSSNPTSADITTFTNFGTQLLTWLITTMTTILNFLLANPIALVSIIMALIVAAVGMIFNILKGR